MKGNFLHSFWVSRPRLHRDDSALLFTIAEGCTLELALPNGQRVGNPALSLASPHLAGAEGPPYA